MPCGSPSRLEQIQGIPGFAVRLRSYLMFGVLMEAGDLAAAERVGAATLASARAVGDLSTVVSLLTFLVILETRLGRPADAAAYLREATHLMLRTDIRFEMMNVLCGCGELCAATGRFADAITAWAALDAVLLQRGQPSTGTNPRRKDFLRQKTPCARPDEVLGPDRIRRAEERGAAMNPATAAEYVLMLTAPGPPPSAGEAMPGNLSARERELVTLVAQGRTDAEIAAQLYISIRTVRSHLDRIRDKTGCRRRADLTRLALSTGLLYGQIAVPCSQQPSYPAPANVWVVLPRPPAPAERGNPPAAEPPVTCANLSVQGRNGRPAEHLETRCPH